jgi:3-deoxy-D-manno-octulosonic-acid transferase
VWVAGSTHPGEEELILTAHALARRAHPDLALILAPRHPERAGEVALLVRDRGWSAARRSALAGPLDRDAIMIVDTVGELAELYAIGDVAFVGGSLVPRGGHNVLEPARLGKPVMVGPDTANFREAAALLEASGGAVVVQDCAELAGRLADLLTDEPRRRRIGEAARRAATSRHGAVQKTLDLVDSLLGHGASAPERER